MTSGERSELGLLYDFVKEWRREDAAWKQLHGAEHDKQDARLNALEDAAIAANAVAQDAANRALSMRAKAAIVLSAAFSALSLVVQLAGRLV